MELLRLLDLKASKAITNQTAKLVLCIEWASIDCGTDLDHRQAVSLSGLSENDYNRQKGLIDKLLNLSKQLTIDEICAQLEINDRLKSDAHQLYNAYQAKQTYYEGDTNSAPILAMAIYQSLKLRKTKNLAATKAKLVQLSKNRKLWKQLEDEWDKWIEKCAPLKSSAATATDNQKMQTNDKRNRNPSKCKPVSRRNVLSFAFKFTFILFYFRY